MYDFVITSTKTLPFLHFLHLLLVAEGQIGPSPESAMTVTPLGRPGSTPYELLTTGKLQEVKPQGF